MKFDKFEIHAAPFICNAYCKCGNDLKEVPNGWLSKALFCPKCESVYQLKLTKVPDKMVNSEFLEQCRKKSN